MSRNEKETIVFVVNVGSLEDSSFHKQTVENAKQLMKNVIEKKIFLEPKDEVGIILMGVDIGNNALQFCNVEDYHPIETCSWEMLEKVLTITPTTFPFKNWITGLRAGINLFDREFEDATRKTIVVIMDCPDAEINQQDVKNIADTILEQDIALLWASTSSVLDYDREQQNSSEKMVRRLCRKVNGKHATLSELLLHTRIYGDKRVKPTGWNCNLEIGDIHIPTQTYLYIVESKPFPPWKNVAQNPESQNPNEYKKVATTKKLADFKKNEYEIEDIVRGYKYGGKFIPITDDFMMDLKKKDTKKSLILYGFVPKKKVKLRERCGNETHILLPGNEAETHFFSLVKAMAELDVVAIVRRVFNDNCEPKMKILYPQADDSDKPWCCLMVDLMFVETRCIIEPRTYDEIYSHLTDDESNAIDSLINHMMLNDPTTEDTDKQAYEPGTISCPDIQHVWNRLAHRALNPLTEEDPPAQPPESYLMELIEMPKYLQTHDLDRCINEIIELFELNKEPVVETPTTASKEDTSTTEKTNESGYLTQASEKTNDLPIEIDMEDLID